MARIMSRIMQEYGSLVQEDLEIKWLRKHPLPIIHGPLTPAFPSSVDVYSTGTFPKLVVVEMEGLESLNLIAEVTIVREGVEFKTDKKTAVYAIVEDDGYMCLMLRCL